MSDQRYQIDPAPVTGPWTVRDTWNDQALSTFLDVLDAIDEAQRLNARQAAAS